MTTEPPTRDTPDQRGEPGDQTAALTAALKVLAAHVELGNIARTLRARLVIDLATGADSGKPWHQVDLAAAAGVTQAAISQIVNRGSSPVDYGIEDPHTGEITTVESYPAALTAHHDTSGRIHYRLTPGTWRPFAELERPIAPEQPRDRA